MGLLDDIGKIFDPVFDILETIGEGVADGLDWAFKTVNQIGEDPRAFAAVAISLAAPGIGTAIGNAMLGAAGVSAASYPVISGIIGNTIVNGVLTGNPEQALKSALAAGIAPQIGVEASKFIESKVAASFVDKMISAGASAAIEGRNSDEILNAIGTAAIGNTVKLAMAQMPEIKTESPQLREAVERAITAATQGTGSIDERIKRGLLDGAVTYGLSKVEIAGFSPRDVPKEIMGVARTLISAEINDKPLSGALINSTVNSLNDRLSTVARQKSQLNSAFGKERADQIFNKQISSLESELSDPNRAVGAWEGSAPQLLSEFSRDLTNELYNDERLYALVKDNFEDAAGREPSDLELAYIRDRIQDGQDVDDVVKLAKNTASFNKGKVFSEEQNEQIAQRVFGEDYPDIPYLDRSQFLYKTESQLEEEYQQVRRQHEYDQANQAFYEATGRRANPEEIQSLLSSWNPSNPDAFIETVKENTENRIRDEFLKTANREPTQEEIDRFKSTNSRSLQEKIGRYESNRLYELSRAEEKRQYQETLQQEKLAQQQRKQDDFRSYFNAITGRPPTEEEVQKLSVQETWDWAPSILSYESDRKIREEQLASSQQKQKEISDSIFDELKEIFAEADPQEIRSIADTAAADTVRSDVTDGSGAISIDVAGTSGFGSERERQELIKQLGIERFYNTLSDSLGMGLKSNILGLGAIVDQLRQAGISDDVIEETLLNARQTNPNFSSFLQSKAPVGLGESKGTGESRVSDYDLALEEAKTIVSPEETAKPTLPDKPIGSIFGFGFEPTETGDSRTLFGPGATGGGAGGIRLISVDPGTGTKVYDTGDPDFSLLVLKDNQMKLVDNTQMKIIELIQPDKEIMEPLVKDADEKAEEEKRFEQALKDEVEKQITPATEKPADKAAAEKPSEKPSTEPSAAPSEKPAEAAKEDEAAKQIGGGQTEAESSLAKEIEDAIRKAGESAEGLAAPSDIKEPSKPPTLEELESAFGGAPAAQPSAPSGAVSSEAAASEPSAASDLQKEIEEAIKQAETSSEALGVPSTPTDRYDPTISQIPFEINLGVLPSETKLPVTPSTAAPASPAAGDQTAGTPIVFGEAQTQFGTPTSGGAQLPTGGSQATGGTQLTGGAEATGGAQVPGGTGTTQFTDGEGKTFVIDGQGNVYVSQPSDTGGAGGVLGGAGDTSGGTGGSGALSGGTQGPTGGTGGAGTGGGLVLDDGQGNLVVLDGSGNVIATGPSGTGGGSQSTGTGLAGDTGTGGVSPGTGVTGGTTGGGGGGLGIGDIIGTGGLGGGAGTGLGGEGTGFGTGTGTGTGAGGAGLGGEGTGGGGTGGIGGGGDGGIGTGGGGTGGTGTGGAGTGGTGGTDGTGTGGTGTGGTGTGAGGGGGGGTGGEPVKPGVKPPVIKPKIPPKVAPTLLSLQNEYNRLLNDYLVTQPFYFQNQPVDLEQLFSGQTPLYYRQGDETDVS